MIYTNYLSEDSVKRESGKKVQFGNIGAAKAVSDVIRTCLGPKAMLKVSLLLYVAPVSQTLIIFILIH